MAKNNGFKVGELLGNSRRAPLAKARHMAMYLLRKDLEQPLIQIGETFNHRDHTTVMHAIGKIERLFTTNQELRHQVLNIRNSLFKG